MGRYDEVGKAFGRARPATGFSLDLRGVVTALSPANLPKVILAPAGEDKLLQNKIAKLRASGHMVIQALSGEVCNIDELNCEQKLLQENGEWQLVSIK